MKTSELSGPALDWAVAKCIAGNEMRVITSGIKPFVRLLKDGGNPCGEGICTDFSTDWSQGGPIMEREGIITFRHNKLYPTEPDRWCGHKVCPRPNMEGSTNMVALALDGPTPLIAVMRCFVASKLGDEVDVPSELDAAVPSEIDAAAVTQRPRQR